MKEHKQGGGAAAPASQDRLATRVPSGPVPAADDRGWGQGAATALERLRRNDYRGRAGQPARERPGSE